MERKANDVANIFGQMRNMAPPKTKKKPDDDVARDPPHEKKINKWI